MSTMVEIKMTNGKTIQGYHNGKTYGDSIYVTPKGYRSGIKIALKDIESMGAMVAEKVAPTVTVATAEHKPHATGVCPRCHTYCDGDCSSR